jgi:acyl carrier protein
MRAVEQIIAETLGIAPEEVTDELRFQSIPEWDSLRHVNLVVALESHLGVQIDADRMIALDSVRAIRAFVNEHAAR